jgi:transposase
MGTTRRTHPDWALEQKRPGTELRYIRGIYYLYAVSSKWNKEKKRAQKVTGKILGKVTENGFIESARRQILDGKSKVEDAALPTIKSISTKSAGLACFLEPLLSDVSAALRKHFDGDADAIYCASLMRLTHQTPLKNMNVHLQENFLSESFPHVSLSDKKVSSLLRSIGSNRERINGFLREFSRTGENILMDITAIHSKSEQMSLNQRGYNAQGSFDPQANLLLLFSQSRHEPVYYRVLPGNIRDVKSVQLTLKEMEAADTVFVADKGFYSESNIEEMEQAHLQYVIPLKRNSSLIDYEPLKKSGKSGFSHFFKFQDRFIFCSFRQFSDGKTLYTFLDDHLRLEEERAFLNRMETQKEEKLTIVDFHERIHMLGTFSIITNLKEKQPQDIYKLYKARMEVETAFDAFKNTLEADRSYMHSDQGFEGWMFINYLALLAYWRMLRVLIEKELLAKFSINDLIMYLSYIRKVRINGCWHLAEITDKTRRLLAKLECHIT